MSNACSRAIASCAWFAALTVFVFGGRCLAATPQATDLPKLPAGYEWQLVPVLSDEFSGNELDASKWQARTPIWNGRAPSRFSPSNVSVFGGDLLLKTTVAGKGRAALKDPWRDRWIHAANVSSVKPAATYGYYEARFRASRLPTTSSFWLQNDLNATGRTLIGEIDIAEQSGAPTVHPDWAHLMLFNTHFSLDGFAHDKTAGGTAAMSTGCADDYHVYGAWWKDARTVWFYLDGKKVGEVTTAGPVTGPMYLYFDTEPFKSRGLPEEKDLERSDLNTMSVDWVRSWRAVRVPTLKSKRETGR